MSSDLTSISRFRWMIVLLADEFEKTDLDRAKSLVKDRLGPAYQKIDEPLAFFDELENQNLINDGDTNYLKTLLEHVSRNDLIEQVENYERERKVVVRQVFRNPSLLEGPFFGRKEIMDRIVGILDETYDRIHCIGISGMPGSGKTRLAKESTYRLIRYGQVIFVDLRELPMVEDIFFAIMHALGVECRSYEPDMLYAYLEHYDPKKHSGAVIILDNADKPLDPGTAEKPNQAYSQFVDLIDNMLNLANPKVKVVVTSRIGLEHTRITSRHLHCFRLDGENDLDIEAAMEIIKYHAGKTEVENEDARTLADLCGKIPLALKVVASRFQDGTVTPRDMIKHLSRHDDVQAQRLVGSLTHLGLAKDDQLAYSLMNTIQKLPEAYQRNLVRLSVIPGTFNMKAAQDILEYPHKDRVGLKLDLQALKYRSLLESDVVEVEGKSNTGSARYSIHLLLRSFLQQLCTKTDNPLAVEYEKGEDRFMSHFGKKIKRTATIFQKDFVKALSAKQDEKANFMHVLECFKLKKFPSDEENDWLHMAVELMMVPKERLSFYRSCKDRAEREGKKQMCAEFCCHESQHLVDLGFDVEAIMPLFDKAESILKELPDQKSYSVQLSYATLYHFRGNVITRRLNGKDALEQLKKCLQIRKEILGDHFLTTRTLNLLGQAMQSAAKTERFGYIHEDMLKAIDYFRRALDMCTRITGSDRHVDTPTIQLNIGACLHELSRYGQALEFFKKSLELERLLGMDGTPGTCITLKNMAMSYFAQEKYDNALPLALRALEGRQALQGVHPNTARSLYFVGAIHLASKRYRDARRYFDRALEMEETLWSRGMPHSPDWEHLKDRFNRLLVIQGNNQAIQRYRKRFKEAEKDRNRGEVSGWIDRGEDDSISTSSSGSIVLPAKRARSSSDSGTTTSSEHIDEKNKGGRKAEKENVILPGGDEADNTREPQEGCIIDTNDGNLDLGEGAIQIETFSLSSGDTGYSGAPPIPIRFGQSEDRTDDGSGYDHDSEEEERKRQAKRKRKEKKKREKEGRDYSDGGSQEEGEQDTYNWDKSLCRVM
ncbi:uncharacterized protein LOC121429514 [Lytechinus variegatus]|uniref:uncharacterized protein LOC121429514 n=1 Tax=Lytechinus variegatus TaxID=7654 RepID=UPI001BB2556A|nr:uncharacterized protein LOC121429514 [Lytechinus variegatus]